MSRELEILYEAFHSEHGIEVELLGNYQVSLQRLYAARRSDPDLEILQISRPPTNSPTHIWIVKKGVQQVASSAGQEEPLFSLTDLLGDD